MQLRRLFLLGLLLGAEASQLVKRQSAGSSAVGGGSSPTDNDDTPSETPTSPGSGSTPTSPADTNTTPSAGGGNNGGTTSTPANDDDTTVTRTTTVTDSDAGTVSQKTTVFTTITSTVTVGITEFKTTTVTSTDAETATKTVYETSTEWANEKRAINIAPRTVNPEGFQVDAEATGVPTVTQVNLSEVELRHKKGRRGQLEKRATITELVTVTVAGKGGKTAVSTVTNTVISTVSTETKTTVFVTETEQANAKTTVTTTSTLVVTSTAVTTGVIMTTTAAPSGAYGGAGTGVPSTGNGSGNTSTKDDGGLSTGAKAGIGAGCGVVGLVLIGALIWFLKRRRNNTKVDQDDMFGSSEVPVGRNSPPPVSQYNRDAAAAIVAPRRAPTKPNSPEGYRGTAIGDGRTGFAKPEAFGSAYSAVSPETNYTRTTASNTPHPDVPEMHSPANTAELANDGGAAKWHDSNAAEIDSTQVTRPTGTAPPQNVYEMPAQNYR